MARKTIEALNYLAFPVLFIISWQALSTSGLFSPVIMPPLEKLGRALVLGLSSGQIESDLGASLLRVLKGYLIGGALALVFGVSMGIFSRVNKFFALFFNAIRQIPPLAWIPLFILWFGIGEDSKIILIAKSSFFPILLNTIEGIHSLPQTYLELSRLYKITGKDLILKMYVPQALPSIFTGLRLGAGSAWMSVVAAEIIVATSGIGYRINDARNLLESDVVITNMAIIGLVGVLMDFLLKKLELLLPFEKYRRV
jgi:sulfonate transport system permease protein